MIGNFQFKVPLISTIKNYPKKYFKYDLVAGLTVAAIAMPQAMAYAELAGAPLAMGLYSTFAAMLFFAFFSSTKKVIVGPDAAMAALTGATLIPFVNGSATHYADLVALLTILIGVASIIAVLVRLSFLSEFLSRPILLGYMAGLALVVIASQTPELLGLEGLAKGSFYANTFYTLTNFLNANIPTVILSILLLVGTLILRKYFKKIPAGLVLLLISILLSFLFDFSSYGIAIVGNIPSGLPIPRIPDINFYDIQNLVIPAFAIMMVSYANTITTARSFASESSENVNTAKELSALGISSIGAGLMRGIPISASGVRTAVNEQTKAKSQISQLLAAVIVGIVLLFFTPVLQYLPLATLAVIIIMAVIKLFNFIELKSIWHAWHPEAILAIITLLGVTFLGIFQGLLLAIFLAIVNLIRTIAFPTDAVLGKAKDGSIRDKSRPPRTEPIPGIIMYRFDAPLHFGNSSHFRERVLQLIDDTPDARWFLWDAETTTSIDSTAGLMLLELIREIRKRNITFCIARLKGPVRSTIYQTHRLSNIFKTIPSYPSIGKALTAFEEEKSTKNK